jgi:hypothetical protein
MIDLITVWPRHLDYPLFRRLVSRNRSHYQRLIVNFTGLTTSQTIEQYVRETLHHALFTTPTGAQGDWRHEATLRGLELSQAPYVLFIEQDFLIREPGLFFGRLQEAITGGKSLIGFKEHGRVHPACLLVKRDLLERTSKDFSAGEAGHDHFWCVTSELEALAELVTLEVLGLERGRDWLHLAGLTHNYDLMLRGSPVNYYPTQFALYNLVCLRIGSHPEFVGLMERCVGIVPVEGLMFGE